MKDKIFATSLTVDMLSFDEQIAYFSEMKRRGIGIHFDVMDGTITDYKTRVTYKTIKKIKKRIPNLEFGIHYMGSNFKCLDKYKTTKPSVLFVHNTLDIAEDLLNNAVLVMGVKIGKSGQAFIPEALNKIKELSEKGTKVYVDGGLNDVTTRLCKDAGASCFAYGSYLYNAYLNNELSQKINALHK